MTYVNKGSATAIGIIFPLLALISLSIRCYGWRKTSRQLEIDDILILPAAFLTIAAGVGMVVGAQMGIVGGHTLPAITPTQYEHLGKFEYSFWICHILAISSIKLSILFLFRRIFKGRAYNTAFDYVNWTLITCVTLWTVIFLFFEIFACGTNPYLSWSSLQSLRGDCVDTFAMQTGCAVFSWVMDLSILIEPLFIVGSLNMKLRRKIQASLIFLFSAFAVVAGLLRMIVWIQIEIQGTSHPSTKILDEHLVTADLTGVVSIILFWTYVEIGIGFLVACLPPCAGLLDKMVHSSLYHLRSLSSRRFFSKTGSTGEGTWKHVGDSQQQAPWEAPAHSNVPSAQRSEEDIELVSSKNGV